MIPLWIPVVIVFVVGLLVIFFAPSGRRRRPSVTQAKEVPTAVARLAEETYHASRVGTAEHMGLGHEGTGPFEGTLPRRKERDNRRH